MTSQIKPIKVWGQPPSPNPFKIAIILKELNLPTEVIHVPFEDVKKPEYLALNPNGRLPTIHDPNTGITLWESGAIIDYLLEHYDKAHRISFVPETPEFYIAKQWLYFQATGQGPYYGQMSWFKKFHPEPVPSAIERYIKEIHRVTGVLESQLANQMQEHAGGDGPWLVGNKISYVDIAFLPWQRLAELFLKREEFNMDDFPLVKGWLDKIGSRESVKSASGN
jgi:glutathione S-transferase